jgi:hypothetical protein
MIDAGVRAKREEPATKRTAKDTLEPADRGEIFERSVFMRVPGSAGASLGPGRPGYQGHAIKVMGMQRSVEQLD